MLLTRELIKEWKSSQNDDHIGKKFDQRWWENEERGEEEREREGERDYTVWFKNGIKFQGRLFVRILIFLPRLSCKMGGCTFLMRGKKMKIQRWSDTPLVI